MLESEIERVNTNTTMGCTIEPKSGWSVAVVLVAHGSQLDKANADAHWMAEQLRQRGAGKWVEVSFLELVQPTIESAVARCVDRGADRVVLLPYFLSPGHHVQRDLEAWRKKLQDRFPSVSIELREPVGRHPLLVEVLCQRLEDGA